jgi:hypothetical protein
MTTIIAACSNFARAPNSIGGGLNLIEVTQTGKFGMFYK